MPLPYLIVEALERDRDRQFDASTQVKRSMAAYIFKCLDQVAENPLTQAHKDQIEVDIDKFVAGIQKTYGDYSRLDEYLRQTGAYDGRGEAQRPPT